MISVRFNSAYGVLFFLFSIGFGVNSIGTELGYTRSQSSTSNSDRFQFSHRFDRQNKVGFSATLSKDTTGTVEDTKSSSFKLSYRHKFLSPVISLAVEAKRTDESYFYEGLGGAIKVGFKLADWDWDDEIKLETRMSFKIDAQGKYYSKNKSENLAVRTFTAGIEQEFFPGFNAGLDYGSIAYATTGTETKNALNSGTVTTTDISSYTANLTKDNISVFAEYNYDFVTAGLSYSQDTPYFSTGTKTTTSEIYADFQVLEQLSVNASFSRGKTEGSTTNSDGWSIGVLASF